jgi:hypothetical protein
MLKLDDVLKKRYMLIEADSTFLVIPFENIKYVQLYPAPPQVRPHLHQEREHSVIITSRSLHRIGWISGANQALE